MAGTQSLISGGELPGLTLLAWVFMDVSGNRLKNSGVSSVANWGTGVATITFSPPLPTAQYMAVLRGTPQPGTAGELQARMAALGSTTGCVVTIQVNGVTTTTGSAPAWVGFYG